MRDEDLLTVWELECDVTKVLIEMTRKGCPVDVSAAQKVRDEMVKEERAIQNRHKGVNFNSSEEVAHYLKKYEINTPRTKKGNASVTNDWLNSHSNPLVQEIANARQLRKIRSDYIEGTIMGPHRHNGRIHACFRQTASDEGGTRSGRLSSANPNMQQVPKRSSWGKRIRTLYCAEEGAQWCKSDYSSQEPRLQVHYALLSNGGKGLPGAAEACQAFTDGIKLYTFFEKATGVDYDTCKMLCLGISYGMGVESMARSIGKSITECEQVLATFNEKAPFLSILFDRTKAAANRRGYIKTILGRRSHFNQWSAGWQDGGFTQAFPFEKAKQVYEGKRIERAHTKNALNRLIQGSAADQTKIAMVELHKAGIDLRLPVHDELNAMVTSDKEVEMVREIMEHAIELKVPTVADIDLGRTWC